MSRRILAALIKITLMLAFLLIFNPSDGQGETVGDNYFKKADNYLLFSQHDSSLIYFMKAASIYEKQQAWEPLIRSKNKISESLSALYQVDKALEAAQEAFSLSDKHMGAVNVQKAVSLANMGNAYYLRGQHEVALEKFNASDAMLEQIPGDDKHVHAAPANLGVGNIFFGTYQYDQAFSYFKNALYENVEILGEDHPYVAHSHMSLANLYRNKGSYKLARENYEKALSISTDYFGERHPDVATAYVGIGDILAGTGTYSLAMQYYNQALYLYGLYINKGSAKYGDVYLSIADLYKNQGKYEDAMKYYKMALELYMSTVGEFHQNTVRSNLGIGNTHVYLKNYRDALDYYNRVLEINFNLVGENHMNTSSVYNNLGSIYYFAGKYDLALNYYQRALRIDLAIHGKDHPNVANSHYNIARVYGDQGETQLALDKVQDAINASIIDFSDQDIFVNPALVNFFDTKDLLWYMQFKGELLSSGFKVNANMKGMDIAINSFILSDSLVEQIRVSYTDRADQIKLAEFSNKIYSSAIDATYTMLELLNEDNVKQIDPDADYETKLKEYQDRFLFFSEKNKGAVLFSTIAEANAKSFGGLPDEMLSDEQLLKSQIKEYTQELAAASDSLEKVKYQELLFNANRSYEFLINDMENNYPRYYDLKYDVRVASLPEIQSFLDDETMMISYFHTREDIYVTYISNDSFETIKRPLTDRYEKNILAFRNSLIYQSNYAYELFGDILYQQLFPKKVAEQFKKIIIIQDGVLSSIPFDALPTAPIENRSRPQDFPYLIKQFAISYSYSANLLFRTFSNEKIIREKAPKEIAAYAPVDFENNLINALKAYEEKDKELTEREKITTLDLSSLPGSKVETESIALKFDQVQSSVNYKSAASESNFKLQDLKNYKYLHISSHAFVNELNPEYSGILLPDSLYSEDGILFSGEIYAVNLNAELVTLSGCETGLGQTAHGEGIIGLSRSLMYAGAKNITVSLWQVNDQSTSELMIDYYDEFSKKKVPSKLDESLSYSTALRNAKLKMIKREKFANPFYWSPFILIGK